ncbi:hypothetical protein [Allobranchiibius sp. GilTou38]|uniref:hypothetical protein n=1 Tax=Allobranchiibius sp. GilTou38 TaxID=2815210 RepID=UPI001AA1C5EE|nr:hypothetical protein [Allobranchiibius sp. GilTou38]MBO1765567.1 hypothetical protein [Allobranchiibius sp. GilTou38]
MSAVGVPSDRWRMSAEGRDRVGVMWRGMHSRAPSAATTRPAGDIAVWRSGLQERSAPVATLYASGSSKVSWSVLDSLDVWGWVYYVGGHWYKKTLGHG